MFHEPEINALSDVCEALKGLDRRQIKRIIGWITGRFGLTGESIPVPVSFAEKEERDPGIFPLSTTPAEPGESADPIAPAVPSAAAELPEMPVKKRRGRLPGKPLPPPPAAIVEPPAIPVNQSTGGLPTESAPPQPAAEEPITEPKENIIEDFLKYETFEELFLFSNTKTEVSKVLLTAAYLQEKENKKELSSLDISSVLKDLGEELTNPSQTVISLLEKKPPLLVYVGDEAGKHARKQFKVTNEGLKIARSYIKQ